jgi:hypothetical protein
MPTRRGEGIGKVCKEEQGKLSGIAKPLKRAHGVHDAEDERRGVMRSVLEAASNLPRMTDNR